MSGVIVEEAICLGAGKDPGCPGSKHVYLVLFAKSHKVPKPLDVPVSTHCPSATHRTWKGKQWTWGKGSILERDSKGQC